MTRLEDGLMNYRKTEKKFSTIQMRQSGKQAVDQSGHWSPQTGACPGQVGENNILKKSF